eukprot:g6592.t1
MGESGVDHQSASSDSKKSDADLHSTKRKDSARSSLGGARKRKAASSTTTTGGAQKDHTVENSSRDKLHYVKNKPVDGGDVVTSSSAANKPATSPNSHTSSMQRSLRPGRLGGKRKPAASAAAARYNDKPGTSREMAVTRTGRQASAAAAKRGMARRRSRNRISSSSMSQARRSARNRAVAAAARAAERKGGASNQAQVGSTTKRTGAPWSATWAYSVKFDRPSADHAGGDRFVAELLRDPEFVEEFQGALGPGTTLSEEQPAIIATEAIEREEECEMSIRVAHATATAKAEADPLPKWAQIAVAIGCLVQMYLIMYVLQTGDLPLRGGS